jgi:hypothetical protein
MESKNTKSNYLDKLKPLVFAKDVTPPKTLRDVIVNIYSRRSAQDVYLVAKSYIKGITFGEVDTAITNLRRKGFLLGNFCHTCKRTVYSKHWTREIPLKLPE